MHLWKLCSKTMYDEKKVCCDAQVIENQKKICMYSLYYITHTLAMHIDIRERKRCVEEMKRNGKENSSTNEAQVIKLMFIYTITTNKRTRDTHTHPYSTHTTYQYKIAMNINT